MSVTTLSDAKAYLNITGSEHDSELQRTLNRAEGMIARRVGPLSQGSVTERVAGDGAPTLRLTQLPVDSLTSLLDADGVAVELDALVVTSSGVVSGATSFSSRYYDATYTCGYGDPLPDGIVEGVLALTQHLWTTQRGPRRPGAPERVANTMPGASYTWPYRVTEAIADYVKVGV